MAIPIGRQETIPGGISRSSAHARDETAESDAALRVAVGRGPCRGPDDAVYDYNRPTELSAMQGYGAALMAGAEVMTMVRSFDIRRVNNTFYYSPRKK